jgi:hypothetical protein
MSWSTVPMTCLAGEISWVRVWPSGLEIFLYFLLLYLLVFFELGLLALFVCLYVFVFVLLADTADTDTADAADTAEATDTAGTALVWFGRFFLVNWDTARCHFQ